MKCHMTHGQICCDQQPLRLLVCTDEEQSFGLRLY